jgi:predicted transposase YdaD
VQGPDQSLNTYIHTYVKERGKKGRRERGTEGGRKEGRKGYLSKESLLWADLCLL